MERLFEQYLSLSTEKKPGTVKHTPPLESLEPAFYAKNPEFILYADSLENFHARKYRQIPLAEFEKMFNIKYQESTMMDPTLRDLFWKPFKSPVKGSYLSDGHAAVTARMHSPLSGLVVVRVNEKIGHALFWSYEAEPLEPGVILGLYSGEYTCGVRQTRELLTDETMTDKKRSARLAYVMDMSDEEHANLPIQNFFSDPRVDSFRVGNLMRFVADLPNQLELQKSFTVQGGSKDYIAVENLARYPILYQGYPVYIVFTARRLMPGEMFGMPYTIGDAGSQWNTAFRLVFDSSGHIIGHFPSKTVIQLDIPKDLKLNKAPRSTVSERLSVEKNMLINVVKNPRPGYAPDEVFRKDVFFTLRLHLKRVFEQGDTARTSWLEELIKQLEKTNDFKAFYGLIQSKFKLENFSSIKNEEFDLLYKEILRHMLALNSARTNPQQYQLKDPAVKTNTDHLASIPPATIPAAAAASSASSSIPEIKPI